MHGYPLVLDIPTSMVIHWFWMSMARYKYGHPCPMDIHVDIHKNQDICMSIHYGKIQGVS